MHESCRNRYFCEDALSGSPLRIPAGTADIVVSDPPYGIAGETLHKHYNRDEAHVIDGYVEVGVAEYPEFTRRWIGEVDRVLRPGGAAFVFSGYTRLREVLDALAGTSLVEINHIIWKYNFGVFTSRKFVSSHYHILYYAKPGGPRTFNRFCRYGSRQKNPGGGSSLYRDLEDVWTVNREYQPGRRKNKNQLPMALLARILQYASNPGDLVCDFFLGSFAVACAARGLDRDSTGFELNPGAFAHGMARLEAIERGSLLDRVPHGADDTLPRAGLPFAEGEVEAIVEAIEKRLASGAGKQQAVRGVCEEFGRGYWSLQKILKRCRLPGGSMGRVEQ